MWNRLPIGIRQIKCQIEFKIELIIHFWELVSDDLDSESVDEISVSWQHTSVSFNLLSTVRISKYQVTALVVFSLYPIINRLHDETEDQVQVPEGEDVPGLINDLMYLGWIIHWLVSHSEKER